MPSFCRHGRLAENCPICSKKPRTQPGTVSARDEARRAAPRPPRPERPASSAPRRRPRASDVVVRRQARNVDDGYLNDLVPGLHASADARRLADELGFATARLDELRDEPVGLYARARELAETDVEEALWLCFQIAWASPLEDGREPFSALEDLVVGWADGELPAFSPESFGPRGGDPRRSTEAVGAYRALVAKAGSQAALLSGEAALTPQRRFDRAFERLALPGFGRAPRYEFVLSVGALGLIASEPSSLQLATRDTMDPTVLAAKRVFKIGDATLLGRRAAELAGECGVPVGALDLALRNWAAREEERVEAGAQPAVDHEIIDQIDLALGVSRAAAEDD